MSDVVLKIQQLAENYRKNLEEQVKKRVAEMKEDDNSHYILYNALGVSDEEGQAIDVYQNKGRFLYKYAGSFIEEAAKICIIDSIPGSKTEKIENPLGTRPKKFEIDCLVNNKHAYEIKWRDATTDGDHINKEHARMRAVSHYGYTPIRLMFFEPLREQAIKIQKKLKNIYDEENGHYYSGEEAWDHIKNLTGHDLKKIIAEISEDYNNE